MRFKGDPNCRYCDGSGTIEYICNSCNGSGEGLYDGSTCGSCKGAGSYDMGCEHCYANEGAVDDCYEPTDSDYDRDIVRGM
jgi:hypothetical protein